jgi:bacterioferritin
MKGNGQGKAQSGSQGQGQPIWQNRLDQMNRNAEQNLADGAYTPGYKANVDEIIAILRRAQAGEWASFLQYWHHYFMASDIHSEAVKDHFKAHAKDEYHHAREIAERIQQLGGVPCDKPEEIARETPTPTEYNHDLRSMIEADLVGERSTIEFYNEIVRLCGFDDNETRHMFEKILREEDEHADDWANLLYAFDGSTGQQIESTYDEIEQATKASGRAGARMRRTA